MSIEIQRTEQEVTSGVVGQVDILINGKIYFSQSGHCSYVTWETKEETKTKVHMKCLELFKRDFETMLDSVNKEIENLNKKK